MQEMVGSLYLMGPMSLAEPTILKGMKYIRMKYLQQTGFGLWPKKHLL